MTTEYIAIHNKSLIARGDLPSIIRKTKAIDEHLEPIVLALDTCKRIDFSWHGDIESVLANAVATLQPEQAGTASKRGRPKLGVTSKEVTLLPRHWEWLASQRGGASVTLRRLVDHAIKHASPEELILVKQNQLHSLMSVLADEPGFEEATRALYRNSRVSFEQAISTWPKELKNLIMEKFEIINDQHQGRTND